MRVHEVSGKTERLVLAALVYNDGVLAQVANKIDDQAFSSKLANMLAARCTQYYKKYKKAPREAIEQYVERRVSLSKDKDEVRGLELILDSISNHKRTVSGKKANTQYLVDQAASLFHQNRLKITLAVAQDALESGDVKVADEAVKKFKDFSQASNTTYTDPFIDTQLISQAYESSSRPLIKPPGALGKFFGSQLNRSNFIGFQGPDKSFKSFWLQEIQYWALLNRLRVMFVGIGDMSQDDYIKRFCSRITGKPERKQTYKYPTGWKQPLVSIRKVFIPKTKKKTGTGLTAAMAKAGVDKFVEHYLRTKERGKFFRMFVDFTISVDQIESKLQEFQSYDNWIPDVLIIDYADRLDPPVGIREKLEQVDYNWKHLRRIAMDYHSLVVTATQVRRSGYRGHLQTRDDAADNKNKNAHVTGMIGINSTADEFQNDTRTLNWIVLRGHTIRNTVHTAGCPAIANPCVISC